MNASASFGRSVFRFLIGLCAAAALPFAASGQFPAGTLWTVGGHGARVNALACAPNGSLIATAGDDQTVKLWATNGTLLRTFTTAPYTATAVAISPDNSELAIGTYAGGYLSGSNGLGQVFLWQASSGSLATNASLIWSNSLRFGKITGLAFSTDGRLLGASDGAGSNYVMTASTGAVVTTLKGFTLTAGTGLITSVAFSSGGLLASGAEDNTISAWNTNGWANSFNTSAAHTSNVTAVAFSPNGVYLATASLDQTIRVWNTTSWTVVQTLTGHSSGVTSVAFAPNNTTIASGAADGTLKLWNFVANTCLATISAHATNVNSLVFLPDGNSVVSAGDDNSAKVWSVPGGTLVAQLGADSSAIRAVAISPDGALCSSLGDSQTIQVRNAATGQLVQSLAGQAGCVSAIAFSPDSANLAAGGGPLDPTIKIWRISDGSLVRSIAATTNGVMALAYSLDGSLLASGGDSVEQTIRVWNAADGSLRTNFPGHTNGVTALVFSPDGSLLASGGRRPDNAVKIWSISSGGIVRSFSTGNANNIESLAFGPDNNTVAIGSSGANNLLVGSVNTGITQGYSSGTNPVFFVSFTPDGANVATASKDAIQFWRVAGATLLQTVSQETFQVSAMAYSPNANLYLYGRGDATMVLASNTLGALGQPALVFTGAAPGVPGSVGFTATVQPWTQYIIQSSPDLMSWSFQNLAKSATGSLSLSEMATNIPSARFFRAVTPP